MLPGLVGWGAQRPSMAQVLEAAEAKKDCPEGTALGPLVRAVERAWTQVHILEPPYVESEPFSSVSFRFCAI